MNNPVAVGSRLKRATEPPRLHPSLTGTSAAATDAHEKPAFGLLPVSLMVLAGLYAAQAAEFTVEAWPLAVLLALPVLAVIVAWLSKPRAPKPLPRRQARELIDRRPILLRPVLTIPPRRPPRITGRVPPQRRLLHNRKPNRAAKIVQSRWIIAHR